MGLEGAEMNGGDMVADGAADWGGVVDTFFGVEEKFLVHGAEMGEGREKGAFWR